MTEADEHREVRDDLGNTGVRRYSLACRGRWSTNVTDVTMRVDPVECHRRSAWKFHGHHENMELDIRQIKWERWKRFAGASSASDNVLAGWISV